MWRPSDEPVVITCALTGGIHGKEANPNLPEQPDEIVEQGIAAAEAGAAMLHVHARNPDGSNTMDPEIYGELHERLCAETDAIVQLTTGGSPQLSFDERINTVRLGAGDVLAEHGAAQLLHRRRAGVLPQPPDGIERFANEIREHDVKPELEIYSAAMMEEAAHLLSLEILEPPYALNFVLHTPTQGGTRGTPYNLLDMVNRLADLPVPQDQLRLTVTSMGATQLPITTIGWRWGSTSASGWRTTSSTGAASRSRATPSWSSGRCGSPRARPAARDAGAGARAARHPRARRRRAAVNRFAGLQRREAEGRPIRVGLIGAGVLRHDVRGAGAADAGRRARGGRRPGPGAGARPPAGRLGGGRIERRASPRDARRRCAILDGLEVVVEATGNPVAGIRHARAAIDAGRHIVMVNVEADVLAGPALAREAARAGVVYSLAYGDQPALICELVDWARTAGFDVVAAGKGTKYLPGLSTRSTPDEVWEHYGLTPERRAAAGMNAQMFTSFLDGTKSAIEMAAVANATGLDVPADGLASRPAASTTCRVLRPRSAGGC